MRNGIGRKSGRILTREKKTKRCYPKNKHCSWEAYKVEDYKQTLPWRPASEESACFHSSATIETSKRIYFSSKVEDEDYV